MDQNNNNEKPDKEKRSSYIQEFKEKGFEISVYSNGLVIKSIDYHSTPLFLDEEKIKSLGLHLDKKKTEKLKKWE